MFYNHNSSQVILSLNKFRLNTIADYDKVIVMEGGEVIEIGQPYELLTK